MMLSRRAQTISIVRQFQMIQNWPNRNDSGRIHIDLAIISGLDLFQIQRVFDARPLIKFAQVIHQIGIILHTPQVALEVAVINQVEAQQRRESAPIGFCDAVSGQIASFVQQMFHHVQTSKYFSCGLFIGFLAGIKAFTAAVLGGIGSVPGAMLGGLLIGMIEVFWAGYFSSEYKDVAAFSILVLVLIFRPTGLLGKPEIEKV